MRRVALALVYALSCYVFFSAFATAWLSKPILEGESASLLGCAISFWKDGELNHVMFGDLLSATGLPAFCLHPPLHYVIAGTFIKLFGPGIVTFVAPSLVLGALGFFVASLVMLLRHGAVCASLTLLIAAGLPYVYDNVTVGRADAALGFFNGLLALASCAVLAARGRMRFLLCAVAGLLAVACVAAHWFGYLSALYFAVVLSIHAVLRRRALIASAICALGGAAAGMACWYLLYGNDLFAWLYFSSLLGSAFKAGIHVSMWDAFVAPFLHDPAAFISIAGLVLLLVAFAHDGIATLRRAGVPSDEDGGRAFAHGHELVVFGFVVAYFVFQWWLVGNYSTQYWINILVVVAPLAARGFDWAIGVTTEAGARFIPAPRAVQAAALSTVVLAMTVLGAPTLIQYFTLRTWDLKSTAAMHDTVTQMLDGLVPRDASVLLGSAAYPYLYGHERITPTYYQIVQRYITRTRDLPMTAALTRYSEEHNRYRKEHARIEPRTLGREIEQQVDALVIGDDCHWWQCRFFDPAVWQQGYNKVATVLMVDPLPNSRPFPNRYPTPRLLTVYFRKDLSASIGRPFSGGIRFENGVALIPAHAHGTGIPPGKEDWLAATVPMRRALLLAYLETQDWFGARPAADGIEAIIADLRDAVTAEFARPWIFSLDQAVDRALLDAPLLRRFVAPEPRARAAAQPAR